MTAAVLPSYTSGVSDTPLLGDTIGANLERTVAVHGAREALVDVPSGRRWTYTELLADVDAVAKALMAKGVAAGDRIGIWAPNCPEWTILQYATARMGAILVNVNPAYRTHELTYVVKQSGMRMLVSALSHKTSDYRGMVDEARPELPGLSEVVYIGDASWDELATGGSSITDEQLAERGASLTPDDPINIQYTSGTTGFPKGATLSHHNILNNGYFVGEMINYTEADRICIPVPFYHCFGMVMGNLAATSHGACMVIPAPSFDPEATLRAVAHERCTSLYGVPTMFIAELDLPTFADHDLSTLRTGIMAGSICPVEVMKRVVAQMNMTEVAISYGMTETSGVDDDPHGRQPRPTHRDRRSLDAAHRVQDRRRDLGRPAPARRNRRAVHPRLQRDARLLGAGGQDRRGDRRSSLDAHRRPGHDGRGRVRQHRRPDQGPGHPWR